MPNFSQSILFELDAQKDALNVQKHGLPLVAAKDFDFTNAIIVEDTRQDYGEQRWNAYGYHSNGRAMVLCFTKRNEKIRYISYRVANKRECKNFLKIFAQ